MSSEFEIEIVFDDGGFDIRKVGLLGEFGQFAGGEGIKIAGGTRVKGN